MRIFFFDNTDPDGFDRVLAEIGAELGQTLCVVISKSGGTKETRNGMIEARKAFESQDLPFNIHAVAITKTGSALDKHAESEGWLARFPMWDWVGGRTSETSAVGLLPAALQGFDVDAMLEGARKCDELTRNPEPLNNPSMLMALTWYFAGAGRGQKDMVIIPYKDRLALFSRYMQQLVMESLGKEKDLQEKVVHQGLTVYGNKGSTDQHAYIQQLRDGLHNFFVIFLQVLHDRQGELVTVEDGITSGDYLFGFLMGTRQALYEKGRQSVTIVVDSISAFHIGVLIALFERAVGLYAAMVGINAYHQPGVEAGKRAAGELIELQKGLISFLGKNQNRSFSSAEIARAMGAESEAENIYKIGQHLAANPERGVEMTQADSPAEVRFSMK
jgi:glucose-6-phosphate isomerase